MTKEEQPISEVNSHIEEYLDYYCGLSHAPGFAVLLKGEWGCGKTWFINKYKQKLEKKKRKFLYVSVYGMTSFTEIENSFFQQLHPVLSSEGMAITGKIFQGLLKASLKIDLNKDGQDDGNVGLQIPNIVIPESFKKADESILIFDDLERCEIDIRNLLGYINYFVEHRDLKVILVANEVKLESDNNYQNIREKLIGKTFDINRDLDAALKSFIREISIADIENFLFNNVSLIEDIYLQSKYDNLRSLKQIILDFERIFQELPEKAKSQPELLRDILQTLMAFSIEIKRGEMLSRQITQLESEYTSGLTMQARRNVTARQQADTLSKEASLESQEPSKLQKIIDRYKFLNFLIYQPLPNLSWWQDFFDLGKINKYELNESILSSKYFADENTPNWIRLWHFYDTDITDNEFHELLKKVKAEYADRKFIEKREILHVTGIFFNLCDNGFYPNKSKQYLLQDAKDYIDNLVKEDKLDLDLIQNPKSTQLYSPTGYKGLGYQGTELEEFRSFRDYIETAKKSALEQKLPKLGLELLDIMQGDKWQFYRMLCINNFSDYQEWDRIYYKIPILNYIKPQDFTDRFFSMNFDYQGSCLWTFSERYKAINITPQLTEELEWLKTIQDLIISKIKNNQGKLSGHRLKILNEEYLSEAIKKLSNNE